MNDCVVITGIGLLTPIGCTAPTFWESLQTGRSGAGPVDGLDTKDLPRKTACQIREPVPGPTDTASIPGRAAQLALAASRQALSDASVTSDELATARPWIVIGTTMGETQFIEDRLAGESSQWMTPDHYRQILAGQPGSISDNVRAGLGISAPSSDLYGACAAGNMAIAAARRRILDGTCDIALAGGADGFSKLAFLGFMRLRVMAADVCRPFDEKRDGLFVGEGSAVFVLERESSARSRGAHIHARILGAGIACENYHPTRPHPDGDGLSRSTLAALNDAGITATDIDYVCAHGTGTPQNDAIEVAVLDKCFPRGVPFSSIKSLTGHTMGAAAAVEAAACVLSIRDQILIPTWNLEHVLQPCQQDAVKGAPRPARVRHVLNNSAGFGGYNSSIILAAP